MTLARWATDEWADIEGRFLRDHVDYAALDVAQLCNVLFSYRVDDTITQGCSREEARDAVKRWLTNIAETYADLNPQHVDPSTWGLEPEHQAGLQNAFTMMGAPSSG